MCDNRAFLGNFAFPVVMSLELNSNVQPIAAHRRATASLRVTHESRVAVVLVAEITGSNVQRWEACRNRAFWEELQTERTAPNSVVMVPEGTLPRSSSGKVDAPSVLKQFPRSRGYLREELQGWVVNRLCEVLYFTPSEFDPSQDWARYGVDSAVALELLADLEDRLGIRLPQTSAECRNPAQLVSEAAAQFLDGGDNLAWWRSPWAVAESL